MAFFLVFGTLILGLAGCVPLSVFSYTEPTPVFVTHVAQQTQDLTLLWSRDDVYELQGEGRLDAAGNTGCFVGDLGEASRYDHVICFDAETGKVNWTNERAPSGFVVVTPAGVFETDLGGSSSGIRKRDLRSGALIWQKGFFDSNPIGLTFFNNQVQLITWKPDRKLWVFDTDGNVLKVIRNTYAFLTTPEVTYTSETGVRAVQTDASVVLWDHVDTGLARVPTVTQDKIFGRSESRSGFVYALDRSTGKLLWQVQDLVYGSGLAYSPDKQRVYVLCRDGDVLAIDENTRQSTIAARFSSPLFLPNINGTAEAYELAYDQEHHILLISLGDSHQLFAFKET